MTSPAPAVNMGPQGYALVVTGAVSEVVCPTDYNQDGNSDQTDIDALIQDIAAGTVSYPPNDPDVNRDGNVARATSTTCSTRSPVAAAPEPALPPYHRGMMASMCSRSS